MEPFVLERQKALKEMIEICEGYLAKYETEGKLEEAAGQAYLLGEYQAMLEEFEAYYGL